MTMTIELTKLDLPDSVDLSTKKTLSIFILDNSVLHDGFVDLIAPSLNKSQLDIAKLLLRMGHNSQVITNKELCDKMIEVFDFPKKSTTRAIREIVNKGILVKVKTTTNGEPSHSKAYCYKFATPDEIVSNTSIVSSAPKKRFTKSHDESFQKALVLTGFTEDSFNTENYEISTYTLSRKSLPQEIIALAPKYRNGKNYAEQEHTHSTGKSKFNYKVEVRSHEQIPTEAALKTHAALVKLALAYNSKMLSQGYFTRPFEQKEFPCKMSQIINVRGITESGPNRERVDLAMSELQYARYSFSGSPLAMKSKHLENFYAQEDDFIFIARLRRNNELVHVEGRDVALPTAYFVTLSDQVLESLQEDNYLFVFPEKIVNGDTLLLSLYITLRERRAIKESIELFDLKEYMYFSGTSKALLKLLKEKLIKQYGEGQVTYDEEEFDFNLHGYYLRFSVNESGHDTLYIVCNREEMITESGAQFDHSKGTLNAPTIASPFLPYIDLKRETEISRLVAEINQKHTIPETLRRVNYRLISFDFAPEGYPLTYYNPEPVVSSLASMFSTHLGYNEHDVFDALRKIQQELKPVGYGGVTIDNDDFEALQNYLASAHALYIDIVDLLDIVKSYRSRKITQWKERDFKEIGKDISAAYKQLN